MSETMHDSVPPDVLDQLGEWSPIKHEILYNFMMMDVNRNVLWKDPSRVPPENLVKMDIVWGDRSWQDSLYAQEMDLFGTTAKKLPNAAVAEAFRS